MNKRYKINPFINNHEITTRSKRITLSRMGRDDNIMITDTSTGEVNGTHVCTFKQVDDSKFVKLFTQNIGMIFNLKSAGIKTLTMMVWMVQNKAINKDVIALDNITLDDYAEECKEFKFSRQTLWRGIKELEQAKIVAKTIRKGYYFINPHFVFNGDRIAFTSVIERKK